MPGAIDAKAINIYMSVTGPFSSQMARNGAAVQTFGNQANAGMAKAQTGMARFGATAAKVATGGAVAIAVGLALSAKAAITFESSFAGVRKTVDTTEEGFARLSDGIRRLATEIPVGVNELARITELGGQLGVDAPNLLEFTEVIAKIGVTTTLSTEEAATGFARLDNIMQLGKDSFDEMGSTIVDLGNNFAATEDEILNFALRVAPIGATVGLATDEVLAIATAFTSVGVRAERGGTAIQKTFIEIAEAAQNGGAELATFADVAGLTADEFAALAESDPAQAFQLFITGLKDLQDEGGNAFAVLDSLHLGNSRVVQSLLAMANAEGVLVDALDLADEAWKDNLALTEEAEKRFETTASQLEILKNRAIDLGIGIGTELLPVIRDFAGGLAAILDWIIKLNPGIKTAIGLAGGLTIALIAMNAHPVILALTAVAGLIALIGVNARESEQRVADLKSISEGGTSVGDLLSTSSINTLLGLGFNADEITAGIKGTEDELDAMKQRANRQGAIDFGLDSVTDFINDDVSTNIGAAFLEINQARKELVELEKEEALVEANRQRARRFGVGNIGDEDVDAESKAKNIFQLRQDIRQGIDAEPIDILGLGDVFIDPKFEDDIEDALVSYKDIIADAFNDIDQELRGQIDSYYEFDDEAEIAWDVIIATRQRQMTALREFEAAIAALNLRPDVENVLRGTITDASDMEAFVRDYENGVLGPIIMALEQQGNEMHQIVADKWAIKAGEIEFGAGDAFLEEVKELHQEILDDPDNTLNPAEAWLGIMESTLDQADSSALKEKMRGIFEAALESEEFRRELGLSTTKVLELIEALNLIPSFTESEVRVNVTGDNFIPDPIRRVRTGDNSGFQANAFGGTIMKDQPTIVGELGKELFVPFSSGTIIPNSKLGGSSTNTTTVIIQNSQHRDLRTDISAGLFEASVMRQVEVLVK